MINWEHNSRPTISSGVSWFWKIACAACTWCSLSCEGREAHHEKNEVPHFCGSFERSFDFASVLSWLLLEQLLTSSSFSLTFIVRSKHSQAMMPIALSIMTRRFNFGNSSHDNRDRDALHLSLQNSHTYTLLNFIFAPILLFENIILFLSTGTLPLTTPSRWRSGWIPRRCCRCRSCSRGWGRPRPWRGCGRRRWPCTTGGGRTSERKNELRS